MCHSSVPFLFPASIFLLPCQVPSPLPLILPLRSFVPLFTPNVELLSPKVEILSVFMPSSSLLVVEKPKISEAMNQYKVTVFKMVRCFEAFHTGKDGYICWPNTSYSNWIVKISHISWCNSLQKFLMQFFSSLQSVLWNLIWWFKKTPSTTPVWYNCDVLELHFGLVKQIRF